MNFVNFLPFHRRMRAHEIYVDDKCHQKALIRLRERMDAGESPYKILGIEECHKYYVDKLVAGLCPISYALYGRIMNLDEEDDFSK